MPPLRRRELLGAILALPLAACCSGCLSSGPATTARSGTASTSQALAQQRFVEAANAICQTLEIQEAPIRHRSEELGGANPSAHTEFALLSRETVKLARAADGRLAALPRPPALAHAIATLLAGYAAEAEDVSELAQSLEDSQPALQQTATGSLNRAVVNDRARAKALGLKACVGE